jgi:hypothetical protein
MNAGDTRIQTQLQNLGYAVAAVMDSASTSADATGKALVFISRSIVSGNVLAKFDTVAVPVINNEGSIMIDMRLSAHRDRGPVEPDLDSR